MVTLAPVIRNITLLISLTFIYSLLLPYIEGLSKRKRTVITGVLFGIFSIFTMNDPIQLTDGGIIDARHVIVMVSTMLAGWQGGLISALISGAYRFYLGNPGVMPGIGSIIGAYAIGVVYNYVTNEGVRFNWRLVVAGLILPFSPLLFLMTMSGGIGFDDLPQVTPVLLVTYPIATYLLTQLLSMSQHRLELMDTVFSFKQRQDAVFLRTPTLLMGVSANGDILNLNPAMETFLARTRSEIVTNEAKITSPIIPARIREPFTTLFEKTLKDGETVRQVLEVELDSQEEAAEKEAHAVIRLDTHFIPIRDKAGDISMVFVQANDITNELALERHQADLVYARQRNQILEQLISDASHHLRTPLTIIGSSRYLIQKHIEHLTTPPETQITLQRQFDKLIHAEQNLNTIIDDLLHLMRVNHSSEAAFQVLNLVPFVRGAVDAYEDVAKKQDKQFQVHLPDDVLYASIMPTAFSHVIENLVENGLRYTHSGDQVTLRMLLDESANPAQICMTVSDTGIGIPQADQAQIFERFYRASNAAMHNKRGTGLGLAIVKETITSHGGRIYVESEVGKGTTFSVYLPLIQTPAMKSTSQQS